MNEPNPLFVSPQLDAVGGTERQCMLQAAALRRAGCGVGVLTWERGYRHRATGAIPVVRLPPPLRLSWRSSNQRPEITKEFAKTVGGSIGGGHSARPKWTGTLLQSVRAEPVLRYLRANHDRIDLVHLHGAFDGVVLGIMAHVCEQLGLPLVVKITNDEHKVHAALQAERSAMQALRKARGLVVLTESMRRHFADLFPDALVEIVPNCVEVPARPSRRSGPILFVGRLIVQKGVDILLRAYSALPCDAPQLRLLGEGPERGRLERLAEELGIRARVDFCGISRDVATHLSMASCFVLPSRWEGVPNALLEAMAHGVPSIATRLSGTETLVGDNGGALLVTPGDVGELSRALFALTSDADLAQRLAHEGRLAVSRILTPERTAARLLDFYCSILAAAP